jgi:hypothetical protein
MRLFPRFYRFNALENRNLSGASEKNGDCTILWRGGFFTDLDEIGFFGESFFKIAKLSMAFFAKIIENRETGSYFGGRVVKHHLETGRARPGRADCGLRRPPQ